jgi:hypothetical protein
MGGVDQMENSTMVRGRGRSRKVIGFKSIKRNLVVNVLSLSLLHDCKYGVV